MVGDYISRDAAISKIRDQGVLGGDYDAYEREEDVVDMLNSIPAADVVEVVRCRECIYYHDYTCDRWADGTLMEQTDYCSRAAKMDGGQDE